MTNFQNKNWLWYKTATLRESRFGDAWILGFFSKLCFFSICDEERFLHLGGSALNYVKFKSFDGNLLKLIFNSISGI